MILVFLYFALGLGAPVWWHLHQLSERRDWEEELRQYIGLHYRTTDLANTLRASAWVPEFISYPYQNRSEAVAQMDFTKLGGRVLPPHLAEKLLESEWPYLFGLHGVDTSLWDGKRWMLPRRAPRITQLRLSQLKLTGPMLAEFPVYPNVFDLDLSDNPITDRGMNYVTRKGRVSQLDLSKTLITDEGLAALAYCANLDSLRLNELQIDGSGLRHLRGATRLSLLQLIHSAVRDEHLRRLPELPGLRYLDLTGTGIDGSGFAWDWVPAALEDLRLDGIPIRSEHLVHLKRFTALKSLTFSGPAELNNGLEHLRALPRLNHLTMRQTTLNDAGLRRLAGLDTPASGETSLLLPALAHLSVDKTDITDAAAPAVRRLEILSSLSVQGTRVGDAFIAGLGGHPSLRYLYLNNTRVTDACVPALLALPKLQTVDVRGTKMTEAALIPLRQRGVVILDGQITLPY